MIIVNQNLERLDAFSPESMSLNIEERKSTASMTLGPDAPSFDVGTWMLEDEEPGAGIVWRVKSIATNYNTDTRTVQLEHIINTLRDSVIFGEVKPSDISGGSTCTAQQAIRKALSYQNIWVLDRIDYSVSNPYSFNGDSVFAALETVTGSLEDACWEYDLTRVPFRISIRRIPDTVASEMRMDRNIQTLRKTVDRSRMYTRIYPIGKDNLHISGEFVSKNEALYGSVSTVETDQSKDSDAELRRWATERLNRHCEPSVTVQISGLELSEATGEPLDHFTINTKCRVPLPEFGTTITEKVTKLSWSDKIREPERVTVTLANLLEDVSSIISNQQSSSKSGSRAGAKNDAEKHAWIIDADDHVGLVAEALLGPDENGVDWSRVSSLIVDGLGIHAQVKKTNEELIEAETKIEMNEEAISLEARRAGDAESQLSSQIRVAADAISLETINRQNADDSLSGRITVESNRISLVVSGTGANAKIKPASIVAAINNGESSIRISANHISLAGNTTISDVFDAGSTGINVKKAFVFLGDPYIPNQGGSYVNLKNAIVEASVSNNTLTLKNLYGNTVTFSKATALDGAWSGGKLMVTASPQGTTFERTLDRDTITWDANHTATVPVIAKWGNNLQYSESTGKNFYVDASDEYSAGQTNGRNGVTVSSVSRSVQTTDPGNDYTALTQATISGDRWLKIDIALSSGQHPGKYKMKLVRG